MLVTALLDAIGVVDVCVHIIPVRGIPRMSTFISIGFVGVGTASMALPLGAMAEEGVRILGGGKNGCFREKVRKVDALL